jgi:molybdate transport system substrate-binding protein
VSKTTIIAVVIIVVVAELCGHLLLRQRHHRGDVIVLCGGSMRAVLEDAIKEYSQVSTDTVVPSYGDSGELCVQIQHTGKGDLYLCHDPFMPWAAERGLIAKWATVGYFDIVLVVPKGNPKNIRELKDLAQPGLRLGFGDLSYSTCGILAKNVVANLDCGKEILKNVKMENKGHQERCTDVAMGTLDAAIVWAPVAKLFADKLDIITVPTDSVDAVTSATYGKSDLRNVKVTLGLTRSGETNPAAIRFYDYATTKCKDIFDRRGFRLAER